jgi:hypothetical protein
VVSHIRLACAQSTLPGSPKPADHAAIVVEKINQLCFPENPLQFVPYLHKQALLASSAPGPTKDSDSGGGSGTYVVYDPQSEYTRLGLLTLNEGAGDGGAWRLSAANADYALSETYPRFAPLVQNTHTHHRTRTRTPERV